MPKYVAFLRGINVGGHNIIRKEKLMDAFTSSGYKDISVYKQSGNVVFSTELTDEKLIIEGIKKKLHSTLGSDIGVFLRTVSYLEELVKSNPFGNVNARNASRLVTFLPNETLAQGLPFKIPNSNAEIIRISKNEAYSVTHGFGEGGNPNPFLEKKLKVQATTRNWNIIKEIVEAYSR